MQNQTKEDVAAFYEEFQKRGKYDYLYGDAIRKDLYVRLIGQKETILEIGCRAGNLTQFYAPGNQVTGIDVDRNALKLFEERLGLKAHWVDVDSEPLPFAEEPPADLRPQAPFSQTAIRAGLPPPGGFGLTDLRCWPVSAA